MKILTLLFASIAFGQVSVLTTDYDNNRSGVQTNETILTQANVSSGNFHLKCTAAFSSSTEKSWASPLIASGVVIGGVPRTLLVIGTMHDVIYAFDAFTCVQVWSTTLATSCWASCNGMTGTVFYNSAANPEIGCLSNQVIDPATNVVYATCVNSSAQWSIYSLNLADGSQFHAPVHFSGSNNGITYADSDVLCRGGLALSGNTLYQGCSSWDDNPLTDGWLFAYNKTTLTQTGIFATVSTTNGGAGVWMMNVPPAVDTSGNVYVTTGNGTCANGTTNWGNAVIKLSSTLSVLDYFRPSNCTTLNSNDADVGMSKVLLMTYNSTQYALVTGKEGYFYVLNTGDMGHIEGGGGTAPYQKFNWVTIATPGGANAPKAWFTFDGSKLLLNGTNYHLQMRAFMGGFFNTSPDWQGSVNVPSPGTILAESSNAGASGSDILWGIYCVSGSCTSSLLPGVLAAYSPETGSLLWSSATAVGDSFGNLIKFTRPVIANGNVYAATMGQVNVYGLIPSATGAGATARPGVKIQ